MDVIFVYIVCVNVITFLLYGVDKWKARKGKRRIPEKTLLALAFVGGAAGALVSMYFFHHKTKKAKFYLLVPLFLILQIGAFCYFQFMR